MIVRPDEVFIVQGTLDASQGTLTLLDKQIPRTKLAISTDAEVQVPFTDMRVWDSLSDLLPQAAATDDLGIIEGVFGTSCPTLQTSDAKTTTVTQYARFQFALLHEYILGTGITIRVRAGMDTTISDGTATVDLEVYVNDGDGAAGSDLCATAAQSINSLTKADKDFDLTTTGLLVGDILDCRITVTITDTAGATAVLGEISQLSLLRDIRG